MVGSSRLAKRDSLPPRPAQVVPARRRCHRLASRPGDACSRQAMSIRIWVRILVLPLGAATTSARHRRPARGWVSEFECYFGTSCTWLPCRQARLAHDRTARIDCIGCRSTLRSPSSRISILWAHDRFTPAPRGIEPPTLAQFWTTRHADDSKRPNRDIPTGMVANDDALVATDVRTAGPRQISTPCFCTDLVRSVVKTDSR